MRTVRCDCGWTGRTLTELMFHRYVCGMSKPQVPPSAAPTVPETGLEGLSNSELAELLEEVTKGFDIAIYVRVTTEAARRLREKE